MVKKNKRDDREEIVKALSEAEQGEDEADVVEVAPKSQAAPVAQTGKKGGRTTPAETTRSAKAVSPSRKKIVVILTVSGAVLLAIAVAGYYLLNPATPGTNDGPVNDGGSADLRVARRIDGVLDDTDDQNKYPIGIMVENHTASRPQSGLDKANVVFEALAEGGITRFLAIYTLTDPVEEIGPVRSARPYYVDWARGYNAMYTHIGGSPKALERIATTNTLDLNQFFNSQYFYRDKSREVASEHTLYTNGRLMTLALLDKKIPASGSYEGWVFKAPSPPAERPSSQHLTINYSTFSYKVDYEYDPVENDYVRSQAEQPHVMRDGTPIRPKNVVVLTVKRRLEQPADGKGRLEMDTTGEGSARYFLDGQETKGTWKKASPSEQVRFFLADGSQLKLNAGQTWIEIVPPEQEVSVR